MSPFDDVTPARASIAATLLLLTVAGYACAQDYPVKAVRIIVPFAPGGPNDLVVRPVAQKLPEVLGQPFVVDYRAGANGIIGTELVAKSAPDTPTFAETRFPDVQVDSRYGMIGPAAMPAAIIARLQAAIAKALGTSEVHERYAALGLEPSAMTAQEYGAYLRDDVVRWRKVVAAAKLSPQ